MDQQEKFFDATLFNDAERERWRDDGAELTKHHDHQQWLLGEWVDAGVGGLTRKTALTEAMKITGYAKTTLWDFARTANKFPESRRRDLSWSHHKEVAVSKLSDKVRGELLDRASADKGNRWSIQELRTQVKNELKKQSGQSAGEQRRSMQVSISKATYKFLTRRAKERKEERPIFVGNILEEYRKQHETTVETRKRIAKPSQKPHRQVEPRQRLAKSKLKRVA